MLQELMHRRTLLRNLLQTRFLIEGLPTPANWKQSQMCMTKPRKTIKKQNHCFNLPHRYFHFVPLLPSNWMEEEEDNDDNDSHNQGMRRIQEQNYLDPPPVLFQCDSFCMTSSGTSIEMVLLDPFDGSVRVFPSIGAIHQETPRCESDESSSSLLAAMEEEQELFQTVWMTTTPMTRPAASVSRPVESSSTFVPLDPSQTTLPTPTTKTPSPPPPLQCLWSTEDCMTLNLADYFPNSPPTERRGDDGEFDLSLVGVDAKPIFSQHHHGHHHEPVGTMIVVGKTLHNYSSSRRGGGTEESVCTEFVAWFRWNHSHSHSHNHNRNHSSSDDKLFGTKSVCRFPWSFHHADMDAQRARCVVSFCPGEGPFGNASTNQVGGAPAEPNANPAHPNMFHPSMNSGGRPQLAIYPLIPVESEVSDHSQPVVHPYFPNPTLTINCTAPVTTFALDGVTGTTLLVATTHGTVEVWKVEEPLATRSTIWNIQERLEHRIQQNAKVGTPSDCPHYHPNLDDDVVMTDGWNHILEQNLPASPSSPPAMIPQNTNSRSLALWQVVLDATRLVASHPVESISVARHLSIATSGFVTLQHGGEGSYLCWWRDEKRTSTTVTASSGHSSSQYQGKEDADYQVAAWINLPLSPRRVPRVYFDGTRLIVLGQDHIGIIILIYHVLSTASSLEDIHLFQVSASVDSSSSSLSSASSSASGGQRGDDHHDDIVAGSGGVYNLSIDATTGKRLPRVRLANRIRHVALGGLSSMDSIHMTCNERFLIVNTKTGHLLPSTGVAGGGSSDGSGAADGLLVIDLLDKTKQERDW
jgi:hypothetical protein